ncbi:putative aldo/keto reductase [Polyplosphaeria fusca]|uniref:Aldo/keto reductase n=1 Tax=Polyplosphaeria fusca TaxID=682080 RepID=A0A9P4QIK6_9PLEO|nr:putative aldo/keto reductase [Polyplosphaeria fusca]
MSSPLRQLGTNGPKVPALGFGLMGLSGGYGPVPSDEERFKILDRAVELGATFWDTADIYLDSEELIGKWFKRTGKRDQIFLASKFGIVMENGLNFKGINSSAEYCKQACERSLERLGVDYIDLYYAHRLNPDTPVEQTMRALLDLQKAGKIKHIGLSEPSSTAILRAHAIAPLTAIQMEYSLFVRDIENASTHILSTCRALGIAIVCSSPLGRGLLTGAFSTPESVAAPGDIRATHMPRFSAENLAANAGIVRELERVAQSKGCSVAQLAIAWLVRQGGDVFPTPGTKRVGCLEENWGALGVRLSEGEEREVREFLDGVEVKGYRSMPGGERFERVDTVGEGGEGSG